MMEKSLLRVLVGASLLGVAGISLTTGIFPTVVSWLFGINSFEVLFQVRSFVIPLALLWAIGGGVVGWQGGSATGVVAIGVCGLVSGLALGALALEGGPLLVLVSLLSGLVYGAVGGLLIGKAFHRPVSESQ